MLSPCLTSYISNRYNNSLLNSTAHGRQQQYCPGARATHQKGTKIGGGEKRRNFPNIGQHTKKLKDAVHLCRLTSKGQQRTHPLCATSVCRNPNFLNISMTVSIGVSSVMVIGAVSNIFFNFNAGAALFCMWNCSSVNNTKEFPL